MSTKDTRHPEDPTGALMDTDTITDMSLSSYLSHIRRLVFPRLNSDQALSTTTTTKKGTNAFASPSAGSSDEKVILVMGNPSADLDSFVSAVVLSYFYNFYSGSTLPITKESGISINSSSNLPGSNYQHQHQHANVNEHATTNGMPRERYVPVLNLPGVTARELWRLRPEFGVAIRGAISKPMTQIPNNETKRSENDSESDSRRGADTNTGPQSTGKKDTNTNKLAQLEDLITVADIKSHPDSTLYSLFTTATTTTTITKQPLFLVDHNAPSIPGLSDDMIRSRFTVVGCIDHHVDEGYVARDASPRTITTGIGSCTSLVVKHLRDRGMWPAPRVNDDGDGDGSGDGSGDPSTTIHEPGSGIQEISRLALAPILIDTSNLRAQGDKCSDTDREAVAFLESGLTPTRRGHSLRTTTTTDSNADFSSDSGAQRPVHPDSEEASWDRDAFYHAVVNTKTNSLNLLTMQETFDRDYKVWREPIGIGSSVDKSSPKEINIGMSSLVKPLSWLVKHAGGVDKFVQEAEAFATAHDRDLGVFAMLTRAEEGKEVVVLALDKELDGLIPQFLQKAGELKLRVWDEDQELTTALDKSLTGRTGGWKIWWMDDTSKSRKQVGPMLREAVRNV